MYAFIRAGVMARRQIFNLSRDPSKRLQAVALPPPGTDASLPRQRPLEARASKSPSAEPSRMKSTYKRCTLPSKTAATWCQAPSHTSVVPVRPLWSHSPVARRQSSLGAEACGVAPQATSTASCRVAALTHASTVKGSPLDGSGSTALTAGSGALLWLKTRSSANVRTGRSSTRTSDFCANNRPTPGFSVGSQRQPSPLTTRSQPSRTSAATTSWPGPTTSPAQTSSRQRERR
mmetsp:Transcript_75164/g.243031  ORF Transcript_75164/g.243031 Transcript_75164/m.243031 type:complete len:233 (-) Transcript_75164:1068-1766(-)